MQGSSATNVFGSPGFTIADLPEAYGGVFSSGEGLGSGSANFGTAASAITAIPSLCEYVVVQAASTNAQTLLVGGVASQYYKLTPGTSVRIDIRDPSKVYVRAASATGDAAWLIG